MSWSPSATYSPSTLGGPISRTSSNDVATPLRLGHVSGSSAWNRRVAGRDWRHTWDESMPKHRRFPRVASGASRRRRNARNLWMRVLVLRRSPPARGGGDGRHDRVGRVGERDEIVEWRRGLAGTGTCEIEG